MAENENTSLMPAILLLRQKAFDMDVENHNPNIDNDKKTEPTLHEKYRQGFGNTKQ